VVEEGNTIPLLNTLWHHRFQSATMFYQVPPFRYKDLAGVFVCVAIIFTTSWFYGHGEGTLLKQPMKLKINVFRHQI